MTLRKNQAGFSAIEVLLILILLAIVAFAGYYVYHSNQAANKSYNSANNTAQSTHAPTSSQSPQNGYLTIKEWGVKLPLSNDLKGASYTLDTSGSVQSISLTVPGGCNSMFAVFRGSATDINPTTEAFGGGGGTEFQSSGKKVGNYYYSDMIGNASSCFDGEAMVPGTANGVKTEAVYSQFKTAFGAMSATDSN